MCGIVGCIGHEGAAEFVVHGLGQLEYRGYDSMGVAVPGVETSIEVVKSLGGTGILLEGLNEQHRIQTSAIGHTRWATHGTVSERNAHPHLSTQKGIAVVHNGMIENHDKLRRELSASGYEFRSETDTEVVPHMIDMLIKSGMEPEEAFTEAFARLQGANALLVLMGLQPDTLFAAKKGSPLALGAHNGGYFVASDPAVWQTYSQKATRLEDGDIATITLGGKPHVRQLHGGPVTRVSKKIPEADSVAEMGDFPNWMLKEIHDQPQTIRAVVSGRITPNSSSVRLGGLESPEIRERLRTTERIIIVACGTSYHAGLIGERLIEELAGLPVEVRLASEFQYQNEDIPHNTAILAISQSGETADTIASVKKANALGLLTLGVNNSPGSTLDNITEAGVHCRAGKEISVASTKAFTSQVATLALIASYLNRGSSNEQQQLMDELFELPGKIERILADTSSIEEVAKKYAKAKNFMYIGRGYEHPVAMEGALKLKEISYIHAEGYAAGELKHGSLALIDEEFPTVALTPDGELYEKTLSNVQEILARNGPVVAVASEGNEAIKEIVTDVLYVPLASEKLQPILNSVVLQLFAYYVAIEKGLNVDRPRNLAKSVTVE